MILLISASWIARIIDVSQVPNPLLFLMSMRSVVMSCHSFLSISNLCNCIFS
jgi:hypothetical protein